MRRPVGAANDFKTLWLTTRWFATDAEKGRKDSLAVAAAIIVFTDLGARLAAILNEEFEYGFDPQSRCAMIWRVG